ncbi:MAG: asparaginase [Myxococcota bacterium]
MARVLLLHTGGTLGMTGSPLKPDAYNSALTRAVPEITKLADVQTDIVFNLDSSDIGPSHWRELAERIAAARDDYDGFVIVHGTDTMAYTASALAFALRGLDRPVILTGAQRPLAALRTDARRNLADAVDVATRDIPEVCICFDGLLFRGCRTTKSSSRDYRAFHSPGVEPLARLGVDVDRGAHIIEPRGEFSVDPRFDPDVAVLHVTPGFNPVIFEALLSSEHRPHGVVLAAFGSGTVPTKHRAIAPVVERAVDAGTEVLVVTQSYGRVDLELYDNSRHLADAGATSGGSMLVEAAVPKLMHAIAVYSDRDERRSYLARNVVGETEASTTH